MRNAFVCCTPYHIIISVHVTRNIFREFDNDIYICNHFSNAEEIYENLKRMNIFRKVYFVKDKDLSYDKSFLKINKIKTLYERNFNRVGISSFEDVYDNISIFSFNFFSVLMIDEIKSKYPNAKVSMFEDGLGTYINSTSRKERMRELIGRLANIIGRKLVSFRLIDELYVFKPELIIKSKEIKLRRIPEIKEDLRETLNRVFGYRLNNKLTFKKYIFFDQTFTQDNIGNFNEINFVRVLKEDLSDLSIKVHPREKIDKYSSFENVNVIKSAFPWELIYMNENPKDSILISITSSAVFTPHLLFNSNVKVILLYKLVGLKERKLEQFLSLINNKNIYVPNSKEELSSIFKGIDIQKEG